MKNLFFFLLSVTLLAACQSSSDDLASPDASSPIAQRSQNERPFYATLDGSLDPNSAPTLCSGDLPLPLLDYLISGNATHLGYLDAASLLHHDDCNVDFGTMTLSASVSGKLIAANGDWIEYTGEDEVNIYNFVTGQGPNGPITGSWTITGGTGRFDGASGSIQISGLVDFATLSFNIEANGTITY